MYEKALRYILLHDRHVKASVGSRVFPIGEVPQGCQRPLITYQGLGLAGDARHQQGAGDLAADDVSVVCWADDYSEAHTLGDHVRQALSGRRGTFDGETLLGIFSSARRSDAEERADRSEHAIAAAEQIWTIWHRED